MSKEFESILKLRRGVAAILRLSRISCISAGDTISYEANSAGHLFARIRPSSSLITRTGLQADGNRPSPSTFGTPLAAAPTFECCLIVPSSNRRGFWANLSRAHLLQRAYAGCLRGRRCPPGTGNAQTRPNISTKSLRFRCPSASSSQLYRACLTSCSPSS